MKQSFSGENVKIHDDHLYHGAALTQIAEHHQFTAINALKISNKTIRVAYRINNDISVYLKYATKPIPRFQEYAFSFTGDHLKELSAITKSYPKSFVALVCVKEREICCVTHTELLNLIGSRQQEAGMIEDIYTILVTAPKGKSLRVYVNAPGKKKTILGNPLIISRNAFPEKIFA